MSKKKKGKGQKGMQKEVKSKKEIPTKAALTESFFFFIFLH